MRRSSARWIGVFAACALVATPLVAGRAPVARADASGTVPVAGPAILSADQLAAWYSSKHKPFNVPGTTVQALAAVFLSEGARENIRGDVAFAQSIVETGYFGFVGSIVKPADNNFAGMGACDSCGSGRPFPDLQTGVRAQIQHLRNYADINSRASNLRDAAVPQWYAWPSLNPWTAAYNFDHFYAKGRAPTWNQMGNGNWATSTIYGATVISVYQGMLAFSGLPPAAAGGADPVGNLETLERVPAGVHMKGWTIDPSTAGATAVDVYVNGVGYARFTADGYRPDVGAAFWFAGSNHGFDATLPISGGTVCVYAINIGSGLHNPLLGCRTLPGVNPIGRLDAVSRGPGGTEVRGWSLDPESTGPLSVDVYADGVGVARLTANQARPDVASAFPAYGSAHGFDAVLPGVGGTVCLYAINTGAGRDNPLLGCRHVLGVDPVGRLDAVVPAPGGAWVRGWALDPDSTAPTNVDIYANGVGVARLVADQIRSDVGSAFVGYGDAHGFGVMLPGVGGTVCAYALNTGPGSRNSLLGCQTV